MKNFLNILTVISISFLLNGCAANFASDEILVLSENQNTVSILGWGDQRVLNVADAACGKYGKSALLVKEFGGTRIERSEWPFDCVR